jgi:spermidine synthase
MDGKQQHTYQYDSNKHRLFTLPHRITTNNNKDIVVVDMTSGHTGRVVVVIKMADVKYKNGSCQI